MFNKFIQNLMRYSLVLMGFFLLVGCLQEGDLESALPSSLPEDAPDNLPSPPLPTLPSLASEIQSLSTSFKPGILEASPQFPVVSLNDYGAVADGVTDSSTAFANAAAALPASGGIIQLGSGEYRLASGLQFTKPIMVRGQGPNNSKIICDLTNNSSCIQYKGFDTESFVPLAVSVPKGSKFFEVPSSLGVVPGSFIEIRQKNDDSKMMTTKPSSWNKYWATEVVGQILRVEGVTGNIIHVDKEIYMDYSILQTPEVRKLDPILHSGVTDVRILKQDPEDGHILFFDEQAYCLVENVVSEMTVKSSITLSRTYGCEIKNNMFLGAQRIDGGGHGYGVNIVKRSTDNLIENNVFSSMRHAVLLKLGASGNVVAYNFMRDAHGRNGDNSAPLGFRPSDIVMHGHYPNHNLVEGNEAENIINADWWGPSGPGNIFFRNYLSLVNSTGFRTIDIRDRSHGQLVIGNILPEEVIIASGVNDTYLKSNLAADQLFNGGNHSLPNSLYLTEKPQFLDGKPWPFYQPVSQSADGLTLPAKDRYLNSL